jgi:hypothetical protein
MDCSASRSPTTIPAQPASSLPAFGPSCREVFSQSYNRVSFLFEHEWRDHPLFALPNLLELARRQPQSPAYAYWSNGPVGVDNGWDSAGGPRYSLADTLLGIGVNDSLAMLKHVEQDTVFGPFVRQIQQMVLDLAGAQMRDDALCARGTLLIASPGRITSYHIDSDVNFLFQIAGDKLFRVYDQTDRAITSHQELENYFLGDPNGAVFKPERQADAKTYELHAGRGVHVPCMGAHWAKNLDAPSVALSINFDLRSITSVGRIYRLNGRLRKLGLNPVPPGTSSWRDNLKTTALSLPETWRRLSRLTHSNRSH